MDVQEVSTGREQPDVESWSAIERRARRKMNVHYDNQPQVSQKVLRRNNIAASWDFDC